MEKLKLSKNLILSDIFEFLWEYRKNIIENIGLEKNFENHFWDIKKIVEKIDKNFPNLIEKIENILDYLTSPIDWKKSQTVEMNFKPSSINNFFSDLEESEKDEKLGKTLSNIFNVVIKSILFQNNIEENQINFETYYWISKQNWLIRFHIYFKKIANDDINKSSSLNNTNMRNLTYDLLKWPEYKSELKTFLINQIQHFDKECEKHFSADKGTKKFIFSLYLKVIYLFFEEKKITQLLEQMENYTYWEKLDFSKSYIFFPCEINFEDKENFLSFFSDQNYIIYEKIYFMILNFLAKNINNYFENKNWNHIWLQNFEHNINFEPYWIIYWFFLKPYTTIIKHYAIRQNSFEQVSLDMERSQFFQNLDTEYQQALRLVLTKLCFFENDEWETLFETLLNYDWEENQAYFEYDFDDVNFLDNELLLFWSYYWILYILGYIFEWKNFSHEEILNNIKVNVAADEENIFYIFIENNLWKPNIKKISS